MHTDSLLASEMKQRNTRCFQAYWYREKESHESILFEACNTSFQVHLQIRQDEFVSRYNWAQAIAADRRFSECMIYGRYVDDVLAGKNHFHDPAELCRVYWFEPAPSEAEFRAFVAEMDSDQVAIGMQSFLNVDTTTIRQIIAAEN